MIKRISVKRIFFITIMLIGIAISIVFVYLNSSMTEYVNFEDLEKYCVQNATSNARSFYIQKISNYYFCVSNDGDPNLSTELFIFKQNGSNKKLTYFGGIINDGATTKNNYSMYYSTFPDEDENYVGNSMVYVSRNDAKIAKAVITIKENTKNKDETFTLDPNEPFVIKIDYLGKIDGNSRAIIGCHFYNQLGEEVPIE